MIKDYYEYLITLDKDLNFNDFKNIYRTRQKLYYLGNQKLTYKEEQYRLQILKRIREALK